MNKVQNCALPATSQLTVQTICCDKLKLALKTLFKVHKRIYACTAAKHAPSHTKERVVFDDDHSSFEWFKWNEKLGNLRTIYCDCFR